MIFDTKNDSKYVPVDSVTIGRVFVPFVLAGIWEGIALLFPEAIVGPMATTGIIYTKFVVDSTWVPALNDTMYALFVASILAISLGISIGVILGLYDILHDTLEIFILSIYSIPKVILFPVFLLLFGITFEGKVVFSMFYGVFPMIIITMSAIRNVDDIYLKMSRSMGLSIRQTFRYLLFPLLSIQLIVGIRLAFNLTFLGLIIAELFAARSGLGLQLQQGMAAFEIGTTVAIVTVILIISSIANIFMYLIQRSLEQRWNIEGGNDVSL
jgi:NitT/TauT family transport system permease protein